MQEVQILLSKAGQYVQSNNWQAALQTTKDLLSKDSQSHQGHSLKAIIHQRLNELAPALTHIRHAIDIAPTNLDYYFQMAEIYHQDGKLLKGIECLDNEICSSSKNLKILLKKAQLYSLLNNHHTALTLLKTAIAISPNNSNLYVKLANCYKQLNQLEDAISHYDKAITLDNKNLLAYINKAIALRGLGKNKEAIAIYEFLLANGAHTPDVYCNYGCVLHDENEHQQSEKALKKALELNPHHILAHEALNSLMWEKQRSEEFLASYNICRKNNQLPSPQLYYSMAAQAILAQQFDRAEDTIQEGIKHFGYQPDLTHELATIYLKQGKNVDKAEALLNDLIKMAPDNARYRIDVATNSIKNGNYICAEQHLDHALKLNPLNQEVWAYKGINWRLQGDDRHLWLNDYDKLVYASELKYPEKYDNLAHFLSVLRSTLVSLHTSSDRPLDQSVRGGTQTLGNLLTINNPVIQEYKQSLQRNVDNYLKRLRFDEHHPFLNRLSNKFTIGGCWSVLLRKSGFHTNHVHPDGWLSGPTYVHVPKEIRLDDPKKAGWVKFGESSLGLAEREEIGKEVCPQEGICVFFPSYIWHGTNPFDSEDLRLTAPCDIFPS